MGRSVRPSGQSSRWVSQWVRAVGQWVRSLSRSVLDGQVSPSVCVGQSVLVSRSVLVGRSVSGWSVCVGLVGRSLSGWSVCVGRSVSVGRVGSGRSVVGQSVDGYCVVAVRR